MRRLFRRAVVSAGASMVLLVPTMALASPSGTVALSWLPATYDYGTLNVAGR